MSPHPYWNGLYTPVFQRRGYTTGRLPVKVASRRTVTLMWAFGSLSIHHPSFAVDHTKYSQPIPPRWLAGPRVPLLEVSAVEFQPGGEPGRARTGLLSDAQKKP